MPRTIEGSNYFANTVRRAERGDLPPGAVNGLGRWLEQDGQVAWDHSWVRLPVSRLNESSRRALEHDRLADKSASGAGRRIDKDRFSCDGGRSNGEASLSSSSWNDHQYVRRHTGMVVTEELFADRVVEFLYSTTRERAPCLFKALTGPRASHLLLLGTLTCLSQGKSLQPFATGDFVVFRPTPDKYDYNHTPVAGTVVDFYEIAGGYHAIQGQSSRWPPPFSKNRRTVTIIDSDVPGGRRIGMVALIETAALMIGGIVQCYSSKAYEQPRPIQPGMFVERDPPKSLCRPGSSTDAVVLQKGQVKFASDLFANPRKSGARSRFSRALGCTAVETEMTVRLLLATRLQDE